MNKQFLSLLFALLIISCSATKNLEKKCYKNSKTILSICWSEKIFLNNYIKLKKGNYFNYYQKLTGVKIIKYRGSYTQLNDTLFFKFCGDTTPKLLTEKAIIDTSKNEIILLTANQRLRYHFKISSMKQ